jgi:hypothetical protein
LAEPMQIWSYSFHNRYMVQLLTVLFVRIFIQMRTPVRTRATGSISYISSVSWWEHSNKWDAHSASLPHAMRRHQARRDPLASGAGHDRDATNSMHHLMSPSLPKKGEWRRTSNANSDGIANSSLSPARSPGALSSFPNSASPVLGSSRDDVMEVSKNVVCPRNVMGQPDPVSCTPYTNPPHLELHQPHLELVTRLHAVPLDACNACLRVHF